MPNKTIEMKVEGMTCTNCARTVSRFLERKGMNAVNVNFATNEVSFDWAEDSLPIEDIKTGIGKLGFTVIEEKEEAPSKEWSLERKLLICSILTAPLFFGHFLMMADIHIALLENYWFQFALALPVFIIGVLHFGVSAWNALKMGNSNMDVLIFTGSTAAFVYSLVGLFTNNGNYIFFETAATIITLVLLGNLMEKRAVQRTTRAIDELNKLQSEDALRILPNGQTERIPLKDVRVGDRLQVNEGDAIPTDSRLVAGEGHIDESMLTGESEPVKKSVGDTLTGASVLLSGNLQIEVTAIGKDTVLSRIIHLVKNAQADEPEIQRLADKISEVFVPVVIGISLLTILLGHFAFGIPFTQALMNGIAVLVISCPCAMGLATPAAIMVGVGRAAREGILIRGSRTLEVFAGAEHIVFDKTGTLTEGRFGITAFNIIHGNEDEIKAAVKELEGHSSHPIARSLVAGIPDSMLFPLREIKETKGLKVEGIDEQGRRWEAGSHKIANHLTDDANHNVFVLCDGALVATIDLEDRLKNGVGEVMDYFSKEKINTYILCGYREQKVAEVAAKIGITHYEAERKPEEKHDRIRELRQKATTVMVGDGINDAAALAIADVGVTFSSASDVAVHSAGLVLLNDSPETFVQAHKISKHTLLTIKQNLFWAFAYNIVAIPIAAMGFLNPMWGALFMAFSDIVVIGNSLRLRGKQLN